MNHRDLLKTLTAQERRSLTRKSDFAGVVATSVCFLTIALMMSTLAYDRVAYGWVMLPLGIVLVFLFTLLHETSHKTVFKTAWLNSLTGWICGLVILLPPRWFRYFHFEHHRFTQIPGKDPELMQPKPKTWPDLLLHLSGIPVWIFHLRTLLSNAKNHMEGFVPEQGRLAVRNESRCLLLIYILLFSGSVYFQTTILLYIWLIPLILGQPFLRLYLLAEHSFCETGVNVLTNTRTLRTGLLIRMLAWNMPYHVEHHTHPGVPFFRLGAFHRIVAAHASTVENGYLSFTRKLISQLD